MDKTPGTANDKTPDIARRLRVKRFLNPNTILFAAGLLFVLAASLTVKNFLSFRNITSVTVQISSTGLMAIGLTFVIITGGIDLSLPTVMAVSAILGCDVMVKTRSIFLGVTVILAVALAIGCFIGFSVARLKMVPMIVTLAAGTMALGVSNWYTAARSISGMPKEYAATFAGNIFGLIPAPAVILLATAIAMHVVLSKKIFGRHLFQVGVNENTARINGVNTTRVTFSVYVISSLTAGLAAIVASARLNSAGPSMGPQNMFMDVVAAVVIGGASVSGGKGSIAGTIMGSVFMGVISNIVNLLGLEYFMILLVKGSIIIAVAYFDILRNGRRAPR
jgi:ribose/xylose/arabinose/galactoside ABC-type transport system permease subunit